jgi:F0F1-type ATP synthase assembly protein I
MPVEPNPERQNEGPSRRPPRSQSPIVVAGRYLSLSFVLPASTFAGYVIGYLLDGWLGTNYLYIVFLLFGIAGGLIQIVRQFAKDIHRDQ